MFHKHKWLESRRVYNEPCVSLDIIKSLPDNVVYDADFIFYGFTNIEFYCECCTKIKIVRIVGKCL